MGDTENVIEILLRELIDRQDIVTIETSSSLISKRQVEITFFLSVSPRSAFRKLEIPNGSLGGFQGGVKLKRRLLEIEGVPFTPSGTVVLNNVWPTHD